MRIDSKLWLPKEGSGSGFTPRRVIANDLLVLGRAGARTG